MQKNNINNDILKLNKQENILYIFACLIIAIIIIIIINKSAFNSSGDLVCSNYVLNTYLYIILAVVITVFIVLCNDKWQIMTNFYISLLSAGLLLNLIYYILMLVLLIFFTYTLQNTNPEKIINTHAIWLILVLLISLVIIPMILLARFYNIIGIAALITIIIVAFTGLIGYYYGDKIITFDWDYYLNIALIIFIIIYIVGFVILYNIDSTGNKISQFIYIFAFIFIIIFILLLLSNHKRLKENAEKCKIFDNSYKNGHGHSNSIRTMPNYPLESWELIIKIYNVFSKVINILLRRRR